MSSDNNSNHNLKHALAAAVGLLVILAVFFGMMFWYVPNRPKPVDEKIIKDRYQTLTQLQAEQQKKLSQYAWVDKEKKIVRIPINHAMEETVRELNKK